jgi:hypothetical protein
MEETLWDKVKETLERGLSKASDATMKILETAKEQAEVARLKLRISGIKSKITKEFAELGGRIYQLYLKEGKEDALKDKEVAKIIDRIRSLEEELKETQAELDKVSK